MYVIATAGHVDHGKSTLVRALTGINPDRLREEQEREMTIDLGFAWMTLPNQETVGIIDVPGHIDFIENMLAGVGGIDLALLVIAADEGPMPQTREHLAILNLLRAPRAVVALTKADLVADDGWLALVSADIRNLLSETTLADSPIIPVSARTGSGITELVQSIQAVLEQIRLLRAEGGLGQRDVRRPRLPIDRVFSMAGFGTVVTGTLVDGSFSAGDEVEIMPQGLAARIRGLQTHRQKLDTALPGSRTAINLSGVSVEQAPRGSIVARPGQLRAGTLLDVQLEVLAAPFVRAAIRHNTEVKLFCRTSEHMARLRLLSAAELAPGASGLAQLELTTPIAAVNGDRFIIRLPSPSLTIGGGSIIDAHPAMRYRRRAGKVDAAVLARLEAMLQGTPAQRLEKTLLRLGFTTRAEAMPPAGLSDVEFTAACDELAAAGAILRSGDVLAVDSLWRDTLAILERVTAQYHAAQPLADGIPRESLRNKLALAPRVFNAVLAHAARMRAAVDDGETVRLPGHRARFTPQQQRSVDQLLARFRSQPFNTPSVKDCRASVSDDVYEVLLRQRLLVQVKPDVVFLSETYDNAVQQVREMIHRDGQVTAAQVRDAFSTTRKYALGLLEHLDEIGVTRRVEDARVLR
ncbi:MAG: selenocysteine-specific translation elongation factor [Chloroflexi bacterium]|nr:selenocysteine-specific translation elongation factor [Chloroflexota bacterium]MCL5275561.1 selenocysteine-specific translation elongation factor [Chloroflexota bacterium]